MRALCVYSPELSEFLPLLTLLVAFLLSKVLFYIHPFCRVFAT